VIDEFMGAARTASELLDLATALTERLDRAVDRAC
jgi:hypothetical protein